MRVEVILKKNQTELVKVAWDICFNVKLVFQLETRNSL